MFRILDYERQMVAMLFYEHSIEYPIVWTAVNAGQGKVVQSLSHLKYQMTHFVGCVIYLNWE